MFPDLEVIQPLSRLAEVDAYVLGGKQPNINSGEVLDYSEPTVAQLLAQSYQNPIKWPKVRSQVA
jgi:chromodomain-helicase-DNA-binding protein 7